MECMPTIKSLFHVIVRHKGQKVDAPKPSIGGNNKETIHIYCAFINIFFQIFLFYMNQNLMHKIYIEQSMSQVKIRNVEQHHVYISYNALTQQSKHSMFVIDKARLQDPDV